MTSFETGWQDSSKRLPDHVTAWGTVCRWSGVYVAPNAGCPAGCSLPAITND